MLLKRLLSTCSIGGNQRQSELINAPKGSLHALEAALERLFCQRLKSLLLLRLGHAYVPRAARCEAQLL